MENQSEAVKWEKVYIFISSTFNDMHAERDYLVKRVFPKLSEWCEKRKLHMVDIDLRWGVTEADATQNRNVVKVCLNRIDQCRPFFVCLLGQRYGTIAVAEGVSDETIKNYPGLEDAISKGSSITELEILHSVISPFHSQQTIEEEGYHRSEYAYFYFRDDSYLKDLPDKPSYLRRIYSDTEEEKEEERRKLQTKRDGLIQRIKHEKRPFHIYDATWSEGKTTPEIALPLQCPSALEENQEGWRGDWYKYAGVRVDGLDVEEDPSEAAKAREFNEKLTRGRLVDFKCDGEDLGDIIQRDLVQAVEQRFPDHKEVDILDELQKEIDQQEQFVFINSEGFIRRTGDFDELDEYVKSDSNRLFVLTAQAGMGKSMLLANWMDDYRRRTQSEPDHSIHFRFVGASDGSNTVYSLLRLLLREIKEVAGKLDDDIPDDPQKLRNALPGLLQQIGEHGKTVVVIDALNQLETGLSDLAWLPRQLPDNIKLIVSFKRGEEAAEELYGSLARDERVQLSEVKPFKEEADRRKLIAAYLNQYFKELDEPHIDTLIASPSAHNPLYLKVVLSEMRVFGVFAGLEEKIRTDFGETPVSAFEGMLRRLETDPAYSPIEPGEALSLIFGLLAHSRHGLAIEELTSILLQARGKEDSSKNRQDAEDTVYFFLRQVRPFLARRGGRYDFFYESFKNAAFKRYVAEEAALPKRTSEDWHRLLADYFCSLPLWEEKGEATEELRPRRKLPNSRKVAEQPYHLTGAHDWERLEGTLTDLHFIEAKCGAGMTYDLIADYNLALGALPEAQEERQREREHEARVKKYTEDLIAYARGEIKHLDIIPSVEPWSDERIREDTEGIINNPTRLDRIRAFSQFVNSESHALVKFGAMPGFVLQQAYNSAGSGPVAEASNDIIIRGGVAEMMLLRHQAYRSDYGLNFALQKTMMGHKNSVTSVALSSEGRLAISGSLDGDLRVWNLESGECLKTLKGHTDEVWSVSITPDGRWAVSGSKDTTVRFWDLESGECLRILEGHQGIVTCVDITPEGERAVSGGDDCDVRMWNLLNGECIGIHEHKRWVCSVGVTGDWRWMVVGAGDKKIYLWDLKIGKCLKILKGHKERVSGLSMTPDGRRVVTGSLDNTVRVWDLVAGKCLHVLKGHSREVKGVSVTPDGLLAISGSDDRTIRLWDLEKGECLKAFEEPISNVNGISITSEGRKVVSGSGDTFLRVWDVNKGRPLTSSHGGETAKVWSVNLSPDNHRVVSGGGDNIVRVWDVESGKCLHALEGHRLRIASANVTPDGGLVFSGSVDSDLRIWEVISGNCLYKLTAFPYARIVCADVTADGKRVISGGGVKGRPSSIQVFDLEKRRLLKIVETGVHTLLTLDLTPDGILAITGGLDGELRVWNLESGEHLKTLKGHTEAIESISVTPDGRLVLSASDDATVRLWNLRSGKCLEIIHGHGSFVESVRATLDRRHAISVGWDQMLRIWSLETGECIAACDLGARAVLSEINATGQCGYGTHDGQVIILDPRNFPMESPIVTPVRVRLYGEGNKRGRWDDNITVVCPWGGKRFPVSDEILDVIAAIARNAKLTPDQSPCLELPAAAWEEPRLLSECRYCHKPLRFNPFIVDNRDRY